MSFGVSTVLPLPLPLPLPLSFLREDDESFFFFLDLLPPLLSETDKEIREGIEELSELTDAKIPWMVRASDTGSLAVAALPAPLPEALGPQIKKWEDVFFRFRMWS